MMKKLTAIVLTLALCLTAGLDRMCPACCGHSQRGCDGVRMHKRPPRTMGQCNRPNPSPQGNLLTQAAGGCSLQSLRLGHPQSQNMFTIKFP